MVGRQLVEDCYRFYNPGFTTRSLDDFLVASRWADALSAEQLQRARTAIVVGSFQPGNFVWRNGRAKTARGCPTAIPAFQQDLFCCGA